MKEVRRVSKIELGTYFFLSLAALTGLFAFKYAGVQSDALHYYSYAVSLVWDHDFDLRNQFDHKLPPPAAGTVTNGNYFIDSETGRAFSLFNPGTGVLMSPLLVLGRVVDGLRGGPSRDPYSKYYQWFAGYASILCSALALALLFAILRRFFARNIAAAVPFVFLGGTNWLFYSVVFAGWSHSFALFLGVLLSWAFIRYVERKNGPSAALFGLAGGLLFSTRNFGAVVFGLLAAYLVFDHFRTRKSFGGGKALANGAATAGMFLVGAGPQLFAFLYFHGSPFRTSLSAASKAVLPFGFLEATPFRAISVSNLPYLSSNLFNLENGLFTVHPLFLVGLLGAIFLRPDASRLRVLTLSLLAVVFIFWFADSAYYDNWFQRAAGAGFGHRRFLDFLPLFVFGAAQAFEKGRARAWSRHALALLYALLFAAGLKLLYGFLFDSIGVYTARSSLGGLYGYLFKDWKMIVLGIGSYLVLVALVRRRPDHRNGRGPISWRKPIWAGIFCFAAMIPAAAIKSSPSWERQRFLPKRGFFLMYSHTPYVDLGGRWWGWPDGKKRAMIGREAPLRLPAPLQEGDLLLFRVSPNFRTGGEADLEIWAGGETIGKAQLLDGDRIYSFVVDKAYEASKRLMIKIAAGEAEIPRETAHFLEGRVILKEADNPPFGKIDAPRDESLSAEGHAVLEGWALADRSVVRVYAARSPEGPAVAEARFLEGTRPDVERVYVLYPELKRAAWRIDLDRSDESADGSRVLRLWVVAEDAAGRRTVLGKKTVVWRD